MTHGITIHLAIFFSILSTILSAEPIRLNVFAGALWPDGDGDIVANLQLAREAISESNVQNATLIIDLKPNQHTTAERSVLSVVQRYVNDRTWTPDSFRRGIANSHTVGQGPYRGLRIVLIDSRFDRDPALLPRADHLVGLSLPGSRQGNHVIPNGMPNIVIESADRVTLVREPDGGLGGPRAPSAGFLWRSGRPTLEFNSGFNAVGHYFSALPLPNPPQIRTVLEEVRTLRGPESIPERFINDQIRIAHSYFTEDRSTEAFLESIAARVRAEGTSSSPIVAFVRRLPPNVPNMPANVHIVPYAPLPFETTERLYRAAFLAGGTGDVSMVQMIDGGRFPFLYEIREHKKDVAEQLRNTLIAGIERILRRKLSTEEVKTISEGLFIASSEMVVEQPRFLWGVDKARSAAQALRLATSPEFARIREAGEQVVRTSLRQYSLPSFFFQGVLPLHRSLNVELLAHSGEEGSHGPVGRAANIFFDNYSSSRDLDAARNATIRSLRRQAGFWAATIARFNLSTSDDIASTRAEALQGLTMFPGAFRTREATRARSIATNRNLSSQTRAKAAQALALALFAEPTREDLVRETNLAIASGNSDVTRILSASLAARSFTSLNRLEGTSPAALRSAAYYGLMQHSPADQHLVRLGELQTGRRHASNFVAQVINQGRWQEFVAAIRGAPPNSLFSLVAASVSEEELPRLAALLRENPGAHTSWARFVDQEYGRPTPNLTDLSRRFREYYARGPEPALPKEPVPALEWNKAEAELPVRLLMTVIAPCK